LFDGLGLALSLCVLVCVLEPADAEVGQEGSAFIGNEDVLGLDVTMDDVVDMCEPRCTAELREELQELYPKLWIGALMRKAAYPSV